MQLPSNNSPNYHLHRSYRMSLPCRACIVLLCLPILAIAQQPATQTTPAQSQPSAKEPTLQPRTLPAPGSATGQVQLDVLVEAKPGAPVSALVQKDFTIL